MADMLDDEDYRGKVIFSLQGSDDDDDIVLYETDNSTDNLILKQGNQEVVLSWDEFQELAEFYREYMDELELKYA